MGLPAGCFVFVMLWLSRFWVNGEINARYERQMQKDLPCYNELEQPQYCAPPTRNLMEMAESLVITDWNDTIGKAEAQEFSSKELSKKAWISGTRESRPPHLAESSVTLTINFDRVVELTSLIIEFDSRRPHSFVIYRKTTEDGEWLPYQYFSANCTEVYDLPDVSSAAKYNATAPLCTSNFTQTMPRRGGKVLFSPSLVSTNPNWPLTTGLSITIDRPNIPKNLLHETFKYSYSISNVTIVGKLGCNGHGRHYFEQSYGLECYCMHFTNGSSCEQCLNSHNDAPWQPATKEDPTECKLCNCGGYSMECYFDKQLYESTGHGSHCMNCEGNRNGTNCERCKYDYYMKEDECIYCACNQYGSIGFQCNSVGECTCKLGYAGIKCDQNTNTAGETTMESEHQNETFQNATTQTSTDFSNVATTQKNILNETLEEATTQSSAAFCVASMHIFLLCLFANIVQSLSCSVSEKLMR